MMGILFWRGKRKRGAFGVEIDGIMLMERG